jgi:signal transduction histidine kinase/ligand-binding sensor domain-containing protein
LLTYLGVFFFFGSIIGQSLSQKFYHLTRNNGLSQSTVNCIVKDVTGYMWFGTNDGLNKYDGYNFTYYKYDPLNNKSLGLGRVRTLLVDRKGMIWVGTDQSGLYKYNPEKDNFDRHPRNIGNDERINYNDIRDILETENGNLWIASFGNGLILYDPNSDSVRKLEIKQNINCLTYCGDDLFIGTQRGVLVLKNSRKGYNGVAKSLPIDFFAGMEIFCLYFDESGLLWIGTYGRGAFTYDPSSGKITEYSTQQPYPRRLNHDIVRDIISGDQEGSILIGTGGGGINVWNPERNGIEYVTNRLNDQFSLNTNIIYSFFRDNTENLWVGTYNGGANIIFKSKDKFGHIKSFGGDQDLSNNSVLSIIESVDGKLWIGTDGGGLDLFDPVSRQIKHYKHDPNNNNSLGGNVIKSLLLDRRGILWIGTFNAGLTGFNISKNQFVRYNYDPENVNGISQNHIWDITEDSEGNIWLATLGGGLDMFNPSSGKFHHYRHDPELVNSLSDNMVSCLLYDSKGGLWVGTEFGGVCKLIDKENGTFKIYNRSQEGGRISSNQISVIFEDSEMNIWVGTIGGGLNLYLENEDRFISYSETAGLANNLIYGILEDDNKSLWISTNNGLSKFIHAVDKPSELNFKNYSVGDGLQSNEFSTRSTCKTSDGILYFGGINGMNYFDPSKIIANTHIPPVVIIDFRVFNKLVTVHQQGSPLKVPIELTRNLVLSHKESVISFEFAALDFTMPSKNQYKYMLEGFETEWNEVGNQRTATYTNLDPGDYTFKVIGSNNDDIWNTTGAAIHLEIKPPYWKTWWFRMGVGLFIIFLTIVFYKMKLRSLERNKRELKKQVDERTRELLDLNHLLEKQNKEIQFHREELLAQKESLLKTNTELARNQRKIQEQNEELEKHRHNLEELIRQRTSELERAKLKAEESDRLKSSFLSNMSHEIRTPLNAIVGFSSLLAEDDSSLEERKEFIRQITANTDTLLVLIDDILDLSKIESNQIKIIFSSIIINDFLEEIHTSFAYRNKLKLEFRLNNPYHENHVSIQSDRTRLRQILINLLDNSFKFTHQGYIELGVEKTSKMINFYVEDSGIGMSESVMDKIFERFYKSDENAERVYRGTGLGLTITKKLAKLLGGSINVTSHEGKGSRFTISLPL